MILYYRNIFISLKAFHVHTFFCMQLFRFLFFTLLMLLPFQVATAQQIINFADQQIWVFDDTEINVDGDVRNQGAIINRGNLVLSGNWTNEGTYNAAIGTITLDGNRQQLFNHNPGASLLPQSVFNLTLNGSGPKLLESPLTVGGNVSMLAGNLQAPEGYLQMERDASFSSGSAQSFVEGAVTWRGTGYRYLPLGDGNRFAPVELLDVQGVNLVIRVQAKSDTLNLELSEAIDQRINSTYWMMETLEGQFSESPVRIPVTGEEGLNDLLGPIVIAADTSASRFVSLGKGETTGTRNNGTISSASPFKTQVLALGITSEYLLEDELAIPNAFSPNASNPENRTLRIYGNRIANQGFRFNVFNRWGQRVHTTTSVSEARQTGWDGTDENTGELAQFGIYTYFVRGEFTNGRSFEESGQITLFR